MQGSKNNILLICISLKHSIDRRNHIQEQVNTLITLTPALNIDFEFFDGIYGKKLPEEYISFINIARENAGQCKRPLGVGEIGCMFSHMFIWQRLASGRYAQYDRVIILEDDVTLNSNLISEKLLHIAQSQEAFIFLGGHTRQSRTRIHGYPFQNLYFNMLGPRDLYGAACAYSMTPAKATELLKKLIQKPTYLDDWKYLLDDLYTVQYYFCFEQGGKEDSSINEDRITYRKVNKPNRLQKNLSKMLYDLIARLKCLFALRKTGRLSTFLIDNQEDGYKS
jgi:glycosyl transferase family 25